MVLGLPDPDPLVRSMVLSSSKNCQKNLDSYCCLTSLGLFIFEKWSRDPKWVFFGCGCRIPDSCFWEVGDNFLGGGFCSSLKIDLSFFLHRDPGDQKGIGSRIWIVIISELRIRYPVPFWPQDMVFGMGRKQYCTSMTFWCGSGSLSADPCLWLMDPDPDPAVFVIDLQDVGISGGHLSFGPRMVLDQILTMVKTAGAVREESPPIKQGTGEPFLTWRLHVPDSTLQQGEEHAHQGDQRGVSSCRFCQA